MGYPEDKSTKFGENSLKWKKVLKETSKIANLEKKFFET